VIAPLEIVGPLTDNLLDGAVLRIPTLRIILLVPFQGTSKEDSNRICARWLCTIPCLSAAIRHRCHSLFPSPKHSLFLTPNCWKRWKVRIAGSLASGVRYDPDARVIIPDPWNASVCSVLFLPLVARFPYHLAAVFLFFFSYVRRI